jgi:DNA replication protein DnaC
MLIEQTFEKLSNMNLVGMIEALKDQMSRPEMNDLSFEERFGMVVDHQHLWKENRRMKRLLEGAKLKMQACIDYKTSRGIDKPVLLSFESCEWVRNYQNVIIVGPTGAGKTYLACALAQRACRTGLSAFYIRAPKLYYALAISRADGSYARVLTKLAKTSVLLLDDLGLAPLTDHERRDLLEVIEDRHGSGSTIITSQLPVENWHEVIGDPTIADALLDRLVHNAHRIRLNGDSMRKKTINVDGERKIM